MQIGNGFHLQKKQIVFFSNFIFNVSEASKIRCFSELENEYTTPITTLVSSNNTKIDLTHGKPGPIKVTKMVEKRHDKINFRLRFTKIGQE